MLERLTIKGFKSIASLEGMELKRINVLIGGNGAGKSNLIDFFKMLRAMHGFRLAEFGVYKPSLSAYLRNKGGIGNFLFGGTMRTKEITATLVDSFRGKSSLRIIPTAENDAIADADDVLPIDQWRIYQFHDTTQFARVRQASLMAGGDELEPDGANLARFLYVVRQTNVDAYEQIVETIQLAAPYFDDFVLDSFVEGLDAKVKLQWKQRDMLMTFQPHHISDGTLRFMCLTSALLQPKPPQLIVVDEPELGLHPEALAVLAELIRRCSARTQFILATQSPSFADFFEPEEIVTVSRVDGESRFERQCREKLGPWLESYSIGQLWRKNVIRGGITNG